MGSMIYQGPRPIIPPNYKPVPMTPGMLNKNPDFTFSGGQGVIIAVKNLNVLGTTVTVSNISTIYRESGFWRRLLGNTYQMSEECSVIVLPLQTALFQWTCFGNEPMHWHFTIGTVSDVNLIALNVYSTWVKGMKSNR